LMVLLSWSYLILRKWSEVKHHTFWHFGCISMVFRMLRGMLRGMLRELLRGMLRGLRGLRGLLRGLLRGMMRVMLRWMLRGLRGLLRGHRLKYRAWISSKLMDANPTSLHFSVSLLGTLFALSSSNQPGTQGREPHLPRSRKEHQGEM
jgi:hypothetical protein